MFKKFICCVGSVVLDTAVIVVGTTAGILIANEIYKAKDEITKS